jgi:hypothetical protein
MRARSVLAAMLALAATACTSPPTSAAWRSGTASPVSTPVTPATHVQVRRLPVRLPAGLSRATAFADGSGLLVAGGLTAQQTTTADVLHIDLATGRVAVTGRLASPVHDAAGATLDGRDLLFGGGTGASVDTVQRVQSGVGSALLGHLPQPRSDLVAGASGGWAYVLGGYTGRQLVGTVLRTRDGRTFLPVARIPVPVRYPALAATGTALWVVGGITTSGAATDAVQRLDLRTGAATVVGHAPRPLSHASGFVLNGIGYVAGGQAAGARTDSILAIDPVSGTLNPVGRLPERVSDAAVAVEGDAAYLIGGEAPGPIDTVLEIRTAA